MATGVLLRPLASADLDQLAALAGLLDTVNLPADPAALAALATASDRAFGDLLNKDPAFDRRHASFSLVAVDGASGRLLGTASLFACHGTPESPHYYLKVEDAPVVSRQLGTTRPRTLLTLGRDVEPWTELGGLVVHPEARGRGVGKLLVAARLLLVAMHRARFCDRLLAELLPSRRADGGNAFWDAVGGPLTGLEFYRADLLCRDDKEFIDAFFPHEHLVAELLPEAARALIGREGPATTPVRALLGRAGFRHLGTIDPFDAGPHDGAQVADLTPIQDSRRLVLLDVPPATPGPMGLVASPRYHRFEAMPATIQGDGLRLEPADARRIGVVPGDPVWLMPLAW